jgi:hypothetical protein
LRAAIQETNAWFGDDTIILPAGTYMMDIEGLGEEAAITGDLDILDPVIILGAGKDTTILDANGIDRHFQIHSVDAEISDVSLINGCPSLDTGPLGNENGGSILNNGDLTIIGSRVEANGCALFAGGISNYGTLIIDSTIIKGNHSLSAGGVYNGVGNIAKLINSSVSGNVVWESDCEGGGIFNDGTMEIEGSTIDGNGFGGCYPYEEGAGIYNRGVLNIKNSSITNNAAFAGYFEEYAAGGGIFNEGYLDLSNSSVSGNYATNMGGGLYNRGVAELSSVTISANTVEDCPGCSSSKGGGVYNGTWINPGSLTIQNSIIAGNIHLSSTEFGNNVGPHPDCANQSNIVSLGYNLIGDITGCETILDDPVLDLFGTHEDPLSPFLGPLADNGGLTQTHALLPGSLAIDYIPKGDCVVLTDQTGKDRPQGLGCDIGAYELPQWVIGIDIKPGSSRNTLNPKSKGTIWVAILSAKSFNATESVQQDSISFGHDGWEASLAIMPSGNPNCLSKDVNRDGLRDLVCKFSVQNTGFLCQDTSGILRGKTKDGLYIVGQDSVLIVCP